MNLSQMLRVLWGHRTTVALSLLGCLLLALAVSLAMPKRYSATADIVVDMTSPDPVLGTNTVASSVAGLSYLGTQVEVLRSERVARSAIGRLAPQDNADFEQDWNELGEDREPYRTWAAKQLQKRLRVQAAREGNVIKVTYVANDPKRAARIANEVAHAYLETAVGLRADPASTNAEFFEEQLRVSQRAVEQAREKLSNFQRGNSMTVSDERVDTENARLAELSSQLAAAEGQLAQTHAQVGAVHQRGADNNPTVLNNRLVQDLRTEQASISKEIERARATLGSAHPTIASLNGELRAVQAKLDSELSRHVRSLEQTETSQRSQVGTLRSLVNEQRGRVVHLRTLRDQQAVLQSQFETSQKQYESIANRQTQTAMESQSKQTNSALLTPAEPSMKPSGPSVPINLAVGLLAGAALGAALALQKETRRPRVRIADDLLRILDLPLLASVPRIRLPQADRSRPRASPARLGAGGGRRGPSLGLG